MTQYLPLISKIAIAVGLSLLINAPFAIGEYVTRDLVGPRAEFPLKLFVGLWVEVAIFAYLLISVAQTFRHGLARERPAHLTAQLLLIGILTWAWVTLILDQWPCFFLGGSGC